MEHVSHLDLDALRVGDLAPDRRAAVEGHLESCARCAALGAELAAAAEAFSSRFVASQLAAEAISRSGRARSRWAAPWLAALTAPRLAAAAAAAGLALAVAGTVALRSSRVDEVRLKGDGGPGLELYVASGGGDPVRAPDAVAPGSRLRARLDPGGARYARLLWRDPDGAVTALVPGASGPAIELGAGGPRWIDREIVLDDDPRPETLIAVVCERPVSHERALEGGGPAGCRTIEAPVRKAAPP